jgi:hypothetical protein
VKNKCLSGLFLLLILMTGCVSGRSWKIERTTEPPGIDGLLDEPAWAGAKRYRLERPSGCGRTIEGGTVMLKYDDNYLYVGAELEDTDILMRSTEDQSLLYENGDTLEIFIKSTASPAYIELYSTPAGAKTSIRFPCRSYRHLAGSVDSAGPALNGLRVASRVQGSLNDNSDRDIAWTTEIAIPLRELERVCGRPFHLAGGEWTLLAARYNYGLYLPDLELTAAPKLSGENFHMYEEYGPLQKE